jgi:DUF971 family protein
MGPWSAEQISPDAIEVDIEAGLMRIAWRDGHTSLYTVADLRRSCPCALCQGEMGQPGTVGPHTHFTPAQTQLVAMKEVGRYALQPVWADGHQTGLYTFELLRSLCPCPSCTETGGTKA